MDNMNWKLAGQICGALSKFAFMVHSGYDIDSETIDECYYGVLWDLSEGVVNREATDKLIQIIKDKSGSNYWISNDEPLFFNDGEEDDCCCDECENRCCGIPMDDDSFYIPKHNREKEVINDIIDGLDNIKSIVINFREEE